MLNRLITIVILIVSRFIISQQCLLIGDGVKLFRLKQIHISVEIPTESTISPKWINILFSVQN
jgi:hypothetical protein